MAQKVAGAKIVLETESAQAIRDLKKMANEVKAMRQTVDRSANRVKYAFNKIRRAAQVIASAFIFTAGIRQLGRLASSVELAEDRLKLMQARFAQFARAGDAFTRVYNLSQELGVSLETTAAGMTRLLIATRSLGTAQSDIEQIQKNIVILGRAGGTSAEEMKGALIQLGQGLASGRLQGEELRSVLENLPLVAQEIAAELGIGIGKLREFAAEGKITDKVVVDALTEIGIKMEDLPETFGMQTERLRTEWDLFLADLGKAVESAGLLEELIAAVKFVRLEVLGGFAGVATEDLKAELADLKSAQAVIKANEPRRPVPGSQEDIDRMLTNPEGFNNAEANAELLSIQRRIEAIQQEIAAREALEEINRQAREARDAAVDGVESISAEVGLPDMGIGERTREKIEQQKEQWESWKDQAIKIQTELLTEEERFAEKVALVRRQLTENPLISEEQVEDYINQMEKLYEESKKTSDLSKELGFTFQSAFEDAIIAGEGFRSILKGIIDDVLRLLIRMHLSGPFADWIGGVFGGGKASGGSVRGGTTYLVGEQGPELFTPNSSGMIVPNHALTGGSSVQVNSTLNIGSDSGINAATLIPILEENNRKVKADFLDALDRGVYA